MILPFAQVSMLHAIRTLVNIPTHLLYMRICKRTHKTVLSMTVLHGPKKILGSVIIVSWPENQGILFFFIFLKHCK